MMPFRAVHARHVDTSAPLRRLVAAFAFVAAIALPASDAAADAKPYELDPVHSRIVFAIDHLGFSKSLGTFSHPRGQLRFDPDDWSTATLDVTVGIASLDLGDAKWTQRMLKRDYFDITRFGEARFVSDRVESTGADTARVHGQFTLRGVSRPLVLDVRLNRHGRHPLTLRTTAGFSATATLQRSEFGMTDNLRTVGDTVELRIEAEAERRRDTGDKTDDETVEQTRDNRAAADPANDAPNSSTDAARHDADDAPPSHEDPT